MPDTVARSIRCPEDGGPDWSIPLIILMALAISAPVVALGFPTGHSTRLDLSWLIGFSDQFWAGDLYPRWIARLNNGLGSPVFYYYGPVPFYVASLIDPLVFDDPLRWRTLGYASAAILAASGAAFYMWSHTFTARTPSIAAAALYMALPYHLEFDLYSRAALGEFTAYVWMPLVLLFIRRIAAGSQLAVVGVAVSYCLLIATHLPIAILFTPVAVVYGAFEVVRRPSVDASLRLGVGLLSGIALSSVYLVPALKTQAFISPQFWWTGVVLDYKDNFLFGGASATPQFPVLERLQWTAICGLVGVAALITLTPGRSAIWKRRHGRFWIGVVCASWVMFTPMSRPIWDLVATLQKVQFPWRMLAIHDLSIAALAALAVHGAQRASPQRLETPVRIVILLTVAAGVASIWGARANIFAPRGSDAVVSRLISKGSDAREYKPRWVVQYPNAPGKSLRQFIAETYLPDRVMNQNGGGVTVERWEPGHITVRTEFAEAGSFALRQFYFPSWRARLEGEACCLDIGPSSPEGLLQIQVPAGRKRILIWFEKLPQERLGEWISLATLCLLLAWAIMPSYRKLKARSTKLFAMDAPKPERRDRPS